ncbi:mechanosensitive ion channel protein [Rhizoctonia solani]|uniref:Mechanosensitive ion channel protein n=1 Tax=Rhizoctonia solani TaxID=456999 RepID=A0A8H8T249_9AGAM|nr:mechanosensitive ion channel protein [Rhizoctonia solani]QRW25467.1 mechanosensitive ion channel protein [Rhizoctonia solani]
MANERERQPGGDSQANHGPNARAHEGLRLPSLGMSHQSRSDLFRTDEGPPPTPPYQLDVSKSQEVIERSQPPDYEREGKEKPHVRIPDEVARPPRPAFHRGASSMSYAPSVAGSDFDDDFEEEVYDWSDDDDLLEEEAKFERTTGQRKKVRTGCGFTRIVIFFFSTLIGSTITAGLLATAPILLRIYYLKPHRTEHRTYVTDTVSAWLFWAAANVLVSWYIAVLIDLVPHIIAFAVDTVWGTVSEQLKSRIETYNATKGWIKPPFYAATAWVAWYILFAKIFKLYNPSDEDASVASYTPIIYQVIMFIFFLTLLYCAQKMITQFIALSFHRTAYQERLDAVSTVIKVIDHLRDYKPKRKSHHPNQSSSYFGGRIERDPLMMEEGVSEGAKGKGKRTSKGWFKSSDKKRAQSRSRSSSPDGADELLAQAARTVKRAVLHDARNMRGQNAAGTGANEEDETGLKFKIGSTKEAKKIARDIYYNLKADRRRNYLIPADFFPAYPTPDDARAAFKVFDKDGNDDITRAEIKTMCVKVYRERRFLSRSMKDISAAIQTLDRILLFFAAVILFFISLSVFGVAIGDSLTSVYSLGIAASFIFKNAASSAFDAIMFILLLTQTSDEVGNFEGLTLQVDWRTPLSKLDELETKMNEWLASDDRVFGVDDGYPSQRHMARLGHAQRTQNCLPRCRSILLPTAGHHMQQLTQPVLVQQSRPELEQRLRSEDREEVTDFLGSSENLASPGDEPTGETGAGLAAPDSAAPGATTVTPSWCTRMKSRKGANRGMAEG